jgi:hypothetical protein
MHSTQSSDVGRPIEAKVTERAEKLVSNDFLGRLLSNHFILKVDAAPLWPARPMRPTRMKSVGACGMGHAVDVDATSCDISRDQDPVSTVPKSGQRLIPLVLHPVAVHRYGCQTQPREPLRESIGPVLHSRERQK